MESHREGLRCSRYYYGSAVDVKSALLGKTAKYAPDRSFDTLHIRLELSVDFPARTVSGVCITTLRAFSQNLSELTFDACQLRILSVFGPKGRLRFRYDGSRLAIKLPKPLAAGEQTRVEIRYKVLRPRVGLHFTKDFRQLWSHGQPEDSRYWFPCHDAPHEKVTSEVIATVPRGFTAVSNGILQEKRLKPKTETFHWAMNHPHSVYLISLAVGRFSEIRERWKNVLISYYCQKGKEEDARRGFVKTPKVIEYYSQSLGVPYPYEKYAQVAVSEFPGGMENTTCTTQTDACLIPKEAALDNDLDALVAHELAHQWFGDLVTCKDWSHAWLNEGFATYFENLFTRYDKGDDEADYELYRNQQAYFYEEEHRYRRPIVCNTYKYPWVLFDRHLYEKAAAVLHMLRYLLGDTTWWKSLQHYLTRFKDKNVETLDFVSALEESCGKNLRPFFDQWIHQSGHPCYEVHYIWDAKSKIATLRVLQAQRTGGEVPIFKMPVEFRFTGPGGRWVKEVTKNIEQKEHLFRFPLPGEPAMVEFDPKCWLLKKLDFSKPLALWLEQLQRAQRAQSRIEAAKAVARWGNASAVLALESALRKEKFWGAAAEMAHSLGKIRTQVAFQALQRMLKVRHPKVRRAVVEALGEFRSEETVSLLTPLLRRDPSLHVRAETARAIGNLRNRRHFPLLQSQLKQRSYWDILATGAIEGLANTKEKRALPILEKALKPPFAYPAQAYALRNLSKFYPASPKILDRLCESLTHPDKRMVRIAIQCLGQTKDRRALPALEKLLKTHPDSTLRTYAEEAIFRIRGDSDSAST